MEVANKEKLTKGLISGSWGENTHQLRCQLSIEALSYPFGPGRTVVNGTVPPEVTHLEASSAAATAEAQESQGVREAEASRRRAEGTVRN